MSGLCGYLSLARDEHTYPDASRRLLASMAQPLSQFDASPLQSLVTGPSAAAVAAQPASAHTYRSDSLLVVIWGRPTIDDSGERVAQRLAALWQDQGAQACAALSGPFALCILDSLSGQALLAVDRSGIHSLSYQNVPQGLLFASSAQALQRHPHARTEIDPQAVCNYLYFHMIPAPRTIIRGQHRLLPGEYLHYRRGAVTRGKYWEMRYSEQAPLSFEAQKADFLATLEQSVRQAAAGGEGGGCGKIGAFLSGGTDSSTLAWLLCKTGGVPAHTYSIGFDVAGYDEMAYARIAARHFGAAHHERYVTADDVVDAIPRIAAVFDQPFGNSSAVPAFCCAAMARADGVTRLLGGDGGDELFGGNERYARQALFARYEQMPAPLRQVVLEPLLFGLAGNSQISLLRKARSYVEQALVPMPARLETYNLLQRYGYAQVLEPEFLASIDPGIPLAQLNESYWSTRGLSQINRMQALDLQFTLADSDLPKVNRACELAGLEAAFPFLSDQMLAFSARLAPRDKLNGTQLRHFFKRALRGTLPQAILDKKKHGFGLPFGHWMQTHQGLQSLAYDSLSDLKARRIVRPAFIDELMQTLLSQHPAYHGTMVWVLMMLELWFRQHSAGARSLEGAHDEFEIRQG